MERELSLRTDWNCVIRPHPTRGLIVAVIGCRFVDLQLGSSRRNSLCCALLSCVSSRRSLPTFAHGACNPIQPTTYGYSPSRHGRSSRYSRVWHGTAQIRSAPVVRCGEPLAQLACLLLRRLAPLTQWENRCDRASNPLLALHWHSRYAGWPIPHHSASRARRASIG